MESFLVDNVALNALELIEQITTLKEEIEQAKKVIAEYAPKHYKGNEFMLNKNGGMTIGEINERRRKRILNNAYYTIEANEKALPGLEVELDNLMVWAEPVGPEGQPRNTAPDPDWDPFSLFDE